jgi:hypothetical protein
MSKKTLYVGKRVAVLVSPHQSHPDWGGERVIHLDSPCPERGYTFGVIIVDGPIPEAGGIVVLECTALPDLINNYAFPRWKVVTTE